MANTVILDARNPAGVAIAEPMNMDFVVKVQLGANSGASPTYAQKCMVIFYHGITDTPATSVGSRTAYKYETPAIAEAVYNFLLATCKANNIAVSAEQINAITNVNPTTGAAGVSVAITSVGLFVNGGKVTLNNVTNTEQLDCDTRFGDENLVSFDVPAGVTAARVYDVVWSHPNGNYCYKLASFTAA